jgi:hypothetical protein
MNRARIRSVDENVIAHLLALTVFALIGFIVLGAGHPAHASGYAPCSGGPFAFASH